MSEWVPQTRRLLFTNTAGSPLYSQAIQTPLGGALVRARLLPARPVEIVNGKKRTDVGASLRWEPPKFGLNMHSLRS